MPEKKIQSIKKSVTEDEVEKAYHGANVCHMENKQLDLELCDQSQRNICVMITEPLWDNNNCD